MLVKWGTLMKDLSPGSTDPVNLFHGTNYIGYMFQDVDAVELVEGIVGKGVGKNVQIMDDVGLGFRILIQTNSPADLPVSTTDV